MDIDSYAILIYPDGSMGLNQRFDEIARFGANIVSFQLFSDSRLSFGCSDLDQSNGSFTIDMPRGSVQVVDRDSYAGKEVKPFLRPSDMKGNGGVLILYSTFSHQMKA